MPRALPIFALLLCSVIPARAQVVLTPQSYPTLAALFAACRSGCTVNASSPQTFPDHGILRVPANAHLHFAANAVWSLPAATLDFAGTFPEAPATQILAGPQPAIHLSEARPEWFAPPCPPGDTPEPTPTFLADALAAAYAATDPNAIIRLSAARYVSPFVFGNAAYTSPRVFLGAGTPTLDNPSNPTQLTGGTILLGPFIGDAALNASDLGFDSGPAVTHAFFHDSKTLGVYLHGNGERNTTHGTRLSHIAVLTTDAPSQHSVLIEGQRDVRIDGLTLTTLGGTHGLILKSSDVTVQDFHCTGASSDCLILKSDYATVRNGLAEHIVVDGATITSLHHPGDTGGVVLDGRWDSVTDSSLLHLTEQGTSYGIVSSGSWFHTVRGLRIDNWNATGLTGPCLISEYANDLQLSHFLCAQAPGAPSNQPAFSLTGRHTLLAEGQLSCTGNCKERAAILDGTSAVIRDVTTDGFGAGSLLHQQPELTWGSRVLLVKEHCRILYTMLSTWFALVPRVVKTLAALGLLSMIPLLHYLRSRHRRSR